MCGPYTGSRTQSVFNSDYAARACAEIDGINETHVGWTAGAGVEFAVADNISVDLLYRYSDYGSVDYGAGDDFSLTAHAVTVGLNFKF